jgi:anti-sigma regulatory factor (Ser/Thr protein kinase)
VAEVRNFLSATLATWSLAEFEETGRLLVSELATNAVMHAESPYEVCIQRLSAGIRVEVRDADVNLPTPLLVKPGRSSGRGLKLVAALASDWGVQPERDGKCVWFELT